MSTIYMAGDFEIISDFLRSFEAEEVQGRDRDGSMGPRVPDDVLEQLQRFARGQCSPTERQELCRMLQQHHDWVKHLAALVRGGPAEASSAAKRSA